MKHFTNFGFAGRVARGVGRNLIPVATGVLGAEVGKALVGDTENTPEKEEYQYWLNAANRNPQDELARTKLSESYDAYIKTPSASKERWGTNIGAGLGIAGGLLARSKFLPRR
jgi:hypothetical protein